MIKLMKQTKKKKLIENSHENTRILNIFSSYGKEIKSIKCIKLNENI